MKKTILLVLSFILAFSITQNFTAFASEQTEVPFLLYHSVDTDYDPNGDILLHISADNFKDHMQTLNDCGFCTISLDEYYDFVHSGKALPPNPIVICFDDGYENNYLNAYPILKEFGMKATIFVITSRMGDHQVQYPHFDWQQAAEMEKSGLIDIESHSHTHPDFSTLNYLETVKEMRLSKYLIEKNLNKKCRFMAYPYGIINPYSTRIATDAGYEMICIVGNDGVNRKDTDTTQLHRLNVSGDMDSQTLVYYIQQNMER